jgi:hypothetical protein
MLSGCGAGGARVAPASSSTDAVVWRYEVRAAAGAELLVEAEFLPGGSDALHIDDDAAPFVRDVEYAAGSGWLPAPRDGAAWTAPCRASGCRVRYRFALHEAAVKIDAADTAVAAGDVSIAPPSTWLLRPEDRAGWFRFRVRVDPPARFAAGTHLLAAASGLSFGAPAPKGSEGTGSEDASYGAPTDVLDASSFAVFGPFDARPGSDKVPIQLAIAPQGLAVSAAEVAAWVRSASDAIAAYYGRPAFPSTLVVVHAGKKGSPTRGLTLGDGGPAVLVAVGDGVTAATTRDDWVVTHELLHVTLPSLSRDHVWLSEGIPSYVEPIVRVRAGLVSPEKVWRDLIDGLPQGLPQAGDEGLERTHTWGRTYWGGALFCLLADVTIRERTGNARSLDDVLRAIVATGVNVEARWEIERVLDVGDAATGTTVLHDLYKSMGLAPGSADLPGLWSRLGVRVSGTVVVFDDHAPLAAVRRGIAGR